MGILDNLSSTNWTPFGPSPIAAPGVGLGLAAGRVEAIAPHPTDENTMYAAASGGGTWKTSHWTDTPPKWVALGDTQPSLSYGGYHPIVVHPANTSLVYGFVSGHGAGLLKSTNAGGSWHLLGNAAAGGFAGFEGANIASIAVDPAHTDILYVSIWWGGPGGGVYRSTDGGNNWVNTTSSFHSGGATDVVIASDGKTLYTALVGGSSTGGIYKSVDGSTTNGSASWKLQSGAPTGNNLVAARVEVAATAGVVYIACLVTAGTATNIQRWKTINGGTNWTALAASPGTVENRWWHLLLGVDPKDDKHIFVNDAYSLYESKDGGSHANTWTHADVFNGANIGDDWVNVAFDAKDTVAFTADRDLYRYHPDTKAWSSKEGNLQLTLFYDIALDPSHADTVYGVAQDHPAIMKFSGNDKWSYVEWAGSETGKVLVDPKTTSRLYVSNPLDPNNFVARSTDGGQSWKVIFVATDFSGGDYNLAYAAQKAFVIDPNNPKRVLIGTTKVWETKDATTSPATPTWAALGGVLTSSTTVGDQYITALAIAPSDSKTIYAATADGHVWVSTDGGVTWPQHDTGLWGLGGGTIVDIRIDPQNAKRAYAAGVATGSVWSLSSGSGQWKNIAGDLPNYLQPTTLIPDWRVSPPVIYLGTSRGVYHSVNGGVNWTVFGHDLPNVVVSDLESATIGLSWITEAFGGIPDSIVASTIGRGAWAILTRPTVMIGHVFVWPLEVAIVGPGDPVEGIIVILEAGGIALRSTVTDAQGQYRFENVPPGSYSIRLVAPLGYRAVADAPSEIAVGGSELRAPDFHFRFDKEVARSAPKVTSIADLQLNRGARLR